jgi:hypothetical protein
LNVLAGGPKRLAFVGTNLAVPLTIERAERLFQALRSLPPRRLSMKVENEIWRLAALTPVEMPAGLIHLKSEFCWCDPMVEMDEDGRQITLHQHVMWN